MHFEYLENAKLIEQSNDISLTIAKLKEIDVHVYYKENESQNDLAEMKTITGKSERSIKKFLLILRDMFLTLIQRIQKVSFPKIQRISILLQKRKALSFSGSSVCRFWAT